MTIIEAITGVLCTKGIAIIETLPGVSGNRGNGIYFKGTKVKNLDEQRQYWGTGNIRKYIIDFGGTGEQANLFQGNKRTGNTLGGTSFL